MTRPMVQPGERVAIAGGGCAGYSLALELVERCPEAVVTIYEPETRAPNQKTWCWWETGSHRYESVLTRRWDRVIVRASPDETFVDVRSYPYVCLRAESFFDFADEVLTENGCSVRRGICVDSIDEHADGVELVLRDEHGDITRDAVSVVFDARPPDRARVADSHEPLLYQHFGGIEIAAPSGTFDPSVATLMDFDVDQGSGAHFMYVLPFSDSRALVESTFMTPSIGTKPEYEANAFEYARARLGVDTAEVVYRESGVLPMTLRSLGPKSTARTWQIGTRAGIGRASSGYAFDAIQRDSRRVVDAILRGRQRPAPPRSTLLTILDRVLISWLSADQTAAPAVFSRLFRHADTNGLIRFLADIPRARDYLSVMFAMPKAPVVAHVATNPTSWPRGAG